MAKLPGERGVLRALFGGPPRPTRPSAAEVRARLEALAATARTRDYFEVLGLTRTCSGEEARAAAEALGATLERDLAPEAGDPALALLLVDVRQVVLDAGDVLGDDTLRAAYRQGLDPEGSPEVANGDRES